MCIFPQRLTECDEPVFGEELFLSLFGLDAKPPCELCKLWDKSSDNYKDGTFIFKMFNKLKSI